MRAFIAAQDKMKLNHTTVTSRQEREADSLDVRVASQEKAKEALVKIVASKQEQAENIALRLHAAETQGKGMVSRAQRVAGRLCSGVSPSCPLFDRAKPLR